MFVCISFLVECWMRKYNIRWKYVNNAMIEASSLVDTPTSFNFYCFIFLLCDIKGPRVHCTAVNAQMGAAANILIVLFMLR